MHEKEMKITRFEIMVGDFHLIFNLMAMIHDCSCDVEDMMFLFSEFLIACLSPFPCCC